MSWNAKIRCIYDDYGSTTFTQGKVYTVIDGFIKDDTGLNFDSDDGEFNNINELNRYFESQFELVEDVTDNNVGNMAKSIDKALIHEHICHDLTETYKRKNNDYGDSFAKLRQEFDNAILIRIYDKYSRLKTLKGGTEQKVSDESIKDTLIDLANYCIMELVELEVENEVHS